MTLHSTAETEESGTVVASATARVGISMAIRLETDSRALPDGGRRHKEAEYKFTVFRATHHLSCMKLSTGSRILQLDLRV